MGSTGSLSRRQFLSYSAGGVATLVLAACGGSPSSSPVSVSSPADIGGEPVEGTIHFDTYEGWIGPDTFKDFEAKYAGASISPNYDYSPGDRIAKYLAGGTTSDMMLLELSWLPALSDQGMLAKLDLAAIPNYGEIDKRYKVGPFSDDQALGVVTDSGRYGIGVRTDMVSEPVASWADFYEVSSAYPGRFALEDYSPFGISSALIALGLPINSTNPDEISQARDFLISKKPDLGPLWQNSPVRGLVDGDFYASSLWDLLGPLATSKSPNIEWVFPGDGQMGWVEGWVALASSPVLPAVHAFMDFGLQPQYYADFVNYTGVSNLMPSATSLVDPSISDSPILNPSDDIVSRTVFNSYLGSAQRLYDDAWAAFKAA